MSKRDDKPTSPQTLWQPLVEQWAACVGQVKMPDGAALLPFAPADRTRQRQWLKALEECSDVFLRSPAFLTQMRAHIDRMIESRRDGLTLPATNEWPVPTLGDSDQPSIAFNSPEQLAGSDTWERFQQLLTREPASSSGCTPYQTIYDDGCVRLRRYGSDTRCHAEPILICFALVNRPYVMDLRPDRSVIRLLRDRGFDVFLIEWCTPNDDQRTLSLSDYVTDFLDTAVAQTCSYAGSDRLNLLGYCMGGTLSAMYTAIDQSRIASLTLVAAPIDFSSGDSLLQLWTRDEYFDVDGLIDAYGNCPGEFLKYCFLLMKPVQNFVEKYLRFCEHLEDSAFLDNFFAVEQWANDSVAVAGETFREYVKRLYRGNELVRGVMTLGDQQVDLNAIRCPTMLLVADNDHLVPPMSTLALCKLIGSQEINSKSINTGHIGLVVSSNAHHRFWPDAADWLADRSTPATK